MHQLDCGEGDQLGGDADADGDDDGDGDADADADSGGLWQCGLAVLPGVVSCRWHSLAHSNQYHQLHHHHHHCHHLHLQQHHPQIQRTIYQGALESGLRFHILKFWRNPNMKQQVLLTTNPNMKQTD